MIRTTLALALFLLAAPVTGQNSELVSDQERFQLWTGCSPVNLLVEGLTPDAAEIGLTRESIETLARSRLRAARIFADDPSLHFHFYVNVNVSGHASNISVALLKYMIDATSLVSNYATTWTAGGTSTHGNDAGHVLQGISQFVDTFIDEYLRVNAESCGGPE